MENNHTPITPPRLRLTETSQTYKIEDNLLNGVITTAVMTEGQRPGVWQKMIRALYSGADKTKEGTASAFLFRAMVNSLLEEFHALDHDNM